MKGSTWQELGKISREVMELLRTSPTCTMPVSKFIPAYHHYFGRQCRVADHGYTKLQELFEAIPHAIQVEYPGFPFSASVILLLKIYKALIELEVLTHFT